jgi:hypothetical protein
MVHSSSSTRVSTTEAQNSSPFFFYAKQTQLVATGKYNPAGKSLIVTGVKKMKMADFNVAPPKALMGTINTGNDISISYNMKFTR